MLHKVNTSRYENPLDVEQRQLKDLDFSDIYVCLDGNNVSHYRPRGSGTTITGIDHDVPPEFFVDVEELASLLRNEFDGAEKGLNFGGMRLRASRLETARGDTWAAVRRIPELPPKLTGLGLMKEFVPVLRSLGRRSGLILICGATGQGKTTTASSLLLEYLERYGGVAFTLEDPVEYNLEGRRGKSGYCYQSEIKTEKDWGFMLQRSMRWNPRYIFVGEIRTASAANQLLRAATSGHTVLATIHGGSMEEALEGLLQLAGQDLGGHASTLLAAGLSTVIHQSFGFNGLNASFVVTEHNNSGSPVRAMIREERIGQIRTIADQQMASLTCKGVLANIS